MTTPSAKEEYEFSCSIKIDGVTFNEMYSRFFQKSRKILKIICKDNIRVLIDENSTVQQKKECIWSINEDFSCNDYFLSTRLTKCIESYVSEPKIDCFATDAEADLNILARIKRYFFYDVIYSNFRFAIEYDERNMCHKFHFEYEYDPDNENIRNGNNVVLIAKFKEMCRSNETLTALLDVAFDKKCTIFEILELDLNLSRPFSNKIDRVVRPTYYATKLDGIKHLCVLNGSTLQILYQNKCIRFETNLKQMLIGSVEIVNGKIYLIDLLYVLNSCGIYIHINQYDAVEILYNLKFKSSDECQINNYSKDLIHIKCIIEREPKKYDGWLEITNYNIVKKKSIDTIDLLLVQNRTLKKRSNVFKMLKFVDNSLFSDTDYKLGKFNMRLINNSVKTVQFYIFEFTVDKTEKKIDYLRTRTDKSIPNSLDCFKLMIK